MKIEQLVVMANQIGDFFQAEPNAEQAKKDIALHIKRFWALAMRQRIVTYVNQQQGSDLLPIVGEAIKQHSAFLN